MEYRDFRYSNELGVVELEPGSRVGEALSRLIIKTLQCVMIIIFAGIGLCGATYFIRGADPAKILTAMNPQSAAEARPVIDYRQRPPPPGVTASHAAVTGNLVSVAARDPHAKLFERLVRHPVTAKASPTLK